MNPNTIHFEDTGFPHGLTSKVYAGSAGTVSGNGWITAVTNAGVTSADITFANQAHLQALHMPAATALTLPYPIQVTEFTMAEITQSVVFVPAGTGIGI